MEPDVPLHSLTDNKGLECRFCLDDDESVSRLIRPCNCRGTVAAVHPNCLEMWVEMSKNQVCQMCQIAFEQESAGLKNFREWTLPQPLAEFPNKKLFFMMNAWICYLLLMANVLVLFGFSGLMDWIDSHYTFVYLLIVSGYSFAFGRIVPRVAKSWYNKNVIYKFKDVSTEYERQELDKIEHIPWNCGFCPEDTENISHLIWTCRCRGNLIHAKCLERFFGTAKINFGPCINCHEPVEQEKVGLRKFGEWTIPGPISNSTMHKIEFYCMLIFVGHFLRLVRISMRTDAERRFNMIIYFEYWGFFVLFTTLFACLASLVFDRWYSENITYRFKDRSTVTEANGGGSKKSQRSDLLKRD